MITIISGTNRKNSNTLKISEIIKSKYEEMKVPTQLCNLLELPENLFVPDHYWNTPDSFAPFQKMISETDGILVVVPEYNGSFPGALKYFIDLLKFPESLQNIPAGFIGVSAGVFGALRPIEQLEMVFQYRNAHIFGKRTFIPGVEKKLAEDGKSFTDDYINKKLDETLTGFHAFVEKLKV